MFRDDRQMRHNPDASGHKKQGKMPKQSRRHRAQLFGKGRADHAAQHHQHKPDHRAGQGQAEPARGDLADKLKDQNEGERGDHD